MRTVSIYLFIICGQAYAEINNNNCTIEGLTHNCDIFDSNGSKIEFGDGTYIPNLVKLPPLSHMAVQDTITDKLRSHVASLTQEVKMRLERLIEKG